MSSWHAQSGLTVSGGLAATATGRRTRRGREAVWWPAVAATSLLWLGGVLARGQCTTPGPTCQGYDTTAAARSATTSDAAAGSVVSADNVTFAQAGTITTVCFWGRYDGTAPTPAAEVFTVRVLGDGGGFPGQPLPGGVITLGGATPTAGTTLVRGAALPASAGASAFSWTATIPPIAVSAGQCVWIELAGVGSGAGNRWNWLTVNTAAAGGVSADGVFVRRPAARTDFALNDRVNGFDLAVCTNLTLAASACAPVASANAQCTGATTLSGLPTTVVGSTNLGLFEPTPFCKDVLVGARTLWYRVVGDGTTLTATTCDAATTFDTVLSVYCGACAAGNNDGLNCVASNDDAAGVCAGGAASGRASRVTFATRAGEAYLIAVSGFAGQTGGFTLNVSSNGVVIPANQQPTCASDRCTVSTAGTTAGETETCGQNITADCDDPGTVTLALGTTYRGTLSATGARDTDFFTIPGVPTAGESYEVFIQTQVPLSVAVYAGACTGGGASPGLLVATRTIAACAALAPGQSTVTAVIPASAGGARVQVTTPDFNGLACSAMGNTYTLRVEAAADGACCVLGQACVVVPASECAALGGGAFYGSGTVCTPPSGPGPSDACESVACCGPDGSCAQRTAAECAALGLTPGASFSTCLPNPCPQPTGLCCRGVTCAVGVAPASCVGPATAFTSGSAGPCNAAGNALTPCCRADFNKQSGLTVQDVFDFLESWFSQSTAADWTGNGAGTPGVQSIFDFLSAWFAGGC